MKSIALAAGGTAGHIQPALACAKTLKEKNPQLKILFIGTVKGLEQQIVPKENFELHLIPAVVLPRKINFEILFFPFKLISSILVTSKILKQNNVGCVIGFGAYVSLPAYLAAFLRGIPIIIHEGNKKPGFANRLGKFLTKEVFQMFPNSLKDAKTIGMPLRSELKTFDKDKLRQEAVNFFKLNNSFKTLFVFGGSQGARSINNSIEQIIPSLEGKNIQVIHAVGQKNSIKQELLKHSFYHPYLYVDRMDLAYSAADLVVSRAGAMTIAEQTVLGIPAIYVPFAVGNGEQIKNVQELINSEAGFLVLDSELSAEKISKMILENIFDTQKLSKMGSKAKNFGLIDADTEIAKTALNLLNTGKNNDK